MSALTAWLRGRWLEIALTATPTALAIAVDPWFALAAVLAASWWARHEHRAHTHRPPTPPPDTTTSDTDTQTDRSEATA